jgi:hypothetical protein
MGKTVRIFRLFHLKLVPVVDPAVGDPATATPSRIFFLFFLSRNEKKEVILCRTCFQNRFLTMIATPSLIF